jgi:transcriptional regulator of acetoin/glycerol metabolism
MLDNNDSFPARDSLMDEGETRLSEQDRHRQAKRRLAVINHAREVTGNVAQTWRYYGISRQTYYSWVPPI